MNKFMTQFIFKRLTMLSLLLTTAGKLHRKGAGENNPAISGLTARWSI